MSLERYQRQMRLPQVGEEGQKRLEAARVLVVGVGGLGCPVCQYLVAAGVGSMTLVDADQVALSNLHRQVLFTSNDIGKNKAECAAEWLSAANPDVHISAKPEQLTPANVGKLCTEADVVLDCADTFATSYLLSDHCFATNTPLISASALSFGGYVGGFCGGKPSLRAVFPELPAQAGNCASTGVMGPAVGSIGAMQAQFALNVILEVSPSPLGQLMSLDLHQLKPNGFRFDEAQEPPTASQLRFIGPQDLEPTDYVVDLRGIHEAENREESIHYFSIDQFKDLQPKPSDSQRAVILCRSGLRAWRAARYLQSYWEGDVALMAMGDSSIYFNNLNQQKTKRQK